MIEEALAMPCDQLKDTPLTSEDLRRETIDFVVQWCPEMSRQEIAEVYDSIYARKKFA